MKLFWAHLLDHDDVRAEHFKAAREEHDVGPAQHQTHGHDLGLALHTARSEHAQQHHQACVADTATETTTHFECLLMRRQIWWRFQQPTGTRGRGRRVPSDQSSASLPPSGCLESDLMVKGMDSKSVVERLQ